MKRRCFRTLLFLILGTPLISCTTTRTQAETKAFLIGRWETVTDNEFEVPYVFNDSAIECEEFVMCGRYDISDQDSLTIFGVDTVTFKVTFPEGDTQMMLTGRDWNLRLRKIGTN